MQLPAKDLLAAIKQALRTVAANPKRRRKSEVRGNEHKQKQKRETAQNPHIHATCAQTESMPFAELYQSLHPIAKAALGTVVVLQGVALLAWGYWLVAEIRSDSVQAREKKNK